jgi:methyl-accepting chemotaxis protein
MRETSSAANMSGVRVAALERDNKAASDGYKEQTDATDGSSGQLMASATSAREALEAAKKWADDAERSVAVLSRLSETIAKIASSIETIGRRTKLLSLNAAIEAGRSGSEGMAFGQIALEFKNLAADTSKVATTIGSQLYDVRHQTGEIVDAVNMISSLIDEAAIQISSVHETLKIEDQGSGPDAKLEF